MKKNAKRDPKLVALMDPKEVAYVTGRFTNPATGKNIDKSTVKTAARQAGSKWRPKVYAKLKEMGFVLKPLSRKKKTTGPKVEKEPESSKEL